jgi:methylglutaconyl-CoA hydratase
MNRPRAHNAFDETMIAEMTVALRALDDDPAVRAVVLAGAGPTFCAGADRQWLQGLTDNSFESNLADAMNLSTLLQTIQGLQKPTIARVHGPALGGGAGLVAACDMAVATYEAEFLLGEVRLGLIPATITPYLIRAMGERSARRYCLSGEPFTAAEAFRTGLVTDIAPRDELDGRINELLGHLIQGAPGAQALCKAWFRSAAGLPITPTLIKDGATRLATACAAEEVREGLAALHEKRKPAWVPKIRKAPPAKQAAGKAKPKKR